MSGIISFAFVVAMTPWRAYVLMKLWFWYLVPVWPVLAAPKWNLYGFMLILGWITINMKRDEKKQTIDDHIFNAVASFFGPAMILLVGWVIKVVCL